MDNAGVSAVERFRTLLEQIFGIEHDESKLDILREVMREREGLTGIASDRDYLDHLRCSSVEQEAVARRITIAETYFFRVREQFKALVTTVIPGLLRDPQRRPIRILSCGCASGEEPYTIAMLIADRENEFAGCPFEITGVDLNPAALETARRGMYTPWSLRATDDHFRQRYFERKGRNFQLRPEVRRMVTFRQHNLLENPLASEFDVIFFRNVLIYFSLKAARQSLARLQMMLSDKGYLFLGSAETLRGISEGFEVVHTDEAFYYQRRGQPRATVSAQPDTRFVPTPSVEPAEEVTNTEWFVNIHNSASRIQELLKHNDPGPGPKLISRGEAPPAPAVGHSLDAEELTLSVVSHLNEGDVNAAERACQRLLERGSMDASAHYLMALCREQRGDIDGAIEQDEIAAYLDPTFAMPHLHKGILGCHHGKVEAGCRSLQKSLELLHTEDFSRIVLLCGGFHRQSLIAMCRRELGRCRRVRA